MSYSSWRVRARRPVACLATAALFLVAAPAAAAGGSSTSGVTGGGGKWAYLWADEPSGGDYTPNLSYQRNSKGNDNLIQRDEGVGNYRALFPGVWAKPNDGTVNISNYGAGQRTTCGFDLNGGVDPWYVLPGRTIAVDVDCFEPPLLHTDARFDITYAVRTVHKGRYAYVYADSPGTASYIPLLDHQYNSKGLTNTITHNAVGRFAVHLPGLTGIANGGTVKVTPEKHFLCNVANWGGDDVELVVNVRCFDLDGDPADAHFTMTYANRVNLLGSGKGYGYAWADRPSAASYTPDTFYSAGKPGGDVTITRSSTGIYEVFFSGAGEDVRSDVQVTAYSNVANSCRVRGWGPGDGGQHIGVECYDTDGDAVDSRFTVQFIR